MRPQRQARQRLVKPLRLVQSAWARLLLRGRESRRAQPGLRQGGEAHDGGRFQPVRCDRRACRPRQGRWLHSDESRCRTEKNRACLLAWTEARLMTLSVAGSPVGRRASLRRCYRPMSPGLWGRSTPCEPDDAGYRRRG